jgi:hypothetical protein
LEQICRNQAQSAKCALAEEKAKAIGAEKPNHRNWLANPIQAVAHPGLERRRNLGAVYHGARTWRPTLCSMPKIENDS